MSLRMQRQWQQVGQFCLTTAAGPLSRRSQRWLGLSHGSSSSSSSSAPGSSIVARHMTTTGGLTLAQQHLDNVWGMSPKQLKAAEFNSASAVYLLDCMVQQSVVDKELLSKVVDLIEGNYFSMQLLPEPTLIMEMGTGDMPWPENMFPPQERFQTLIDMLPIEHKVKLILLDDFTRPLGQRPPPAQPSAAVASSQKDAAAQWKTADPVEMEQKEREHFWKGRLKIKRIRHVNARVQRMRAGMKLRSALAVQLAQTIPVARLPALVAMSQVCTSKKLRVLRGDFQSDFEEALCKQLVEHDRSDLRPYTLAVASFLRNCTGSSALRLWRRKLLPLVNELSPAYREEVMRDKGKSPASAEDFLARQEGFHCYLGGVPHITGHMPGPLDLSGDATSNGKDAVRTCAVLAATVQRGARLLICLSTARLVRMDVGLFEHLAQQLMKWIRLWITTDRGAPVEEEQPSELATSEETPAGPEMEGKDIDSQAAVAEDEQSSSLATSQEASSASVAEIEGQENGDTKAAVAEDEQSSSAATSQEESSASAAEGEGKEDGDSKAAAVAAEDEQSSSETASQELSSAAEIKGKEDSNSEAEEPARRRSEPASRFLQELLALEVIADLLDACVASGVGHQQLVECLSDLFMEQFRDQGPALAKANFQDLTTIAHGLAFIGGCSHGSSSQEALSMIWDATTDRLKTAQPHLVLMLLNAMVRGAAEELITSKEFIDAVDENLTKRLDFDPQTLGHLGA